MENHSKIIGNINVSNSFRLKPDCHHLTPALFTSPPAPSPKGEGEERYSYHS